MIRRVAVVLNSKAGALLDSDDPETVMRDAFAAAGLEPMFVPLDAGTLPQRIERAAALGADAVVVAGGDGTVASAALALRGTAVPLAILPSGTLNLLAKDLHLPIGNVAAAISVIAGGSVRAIDVGEVNGHVFLCASMLGFPARLGRTREETRGSVLRTWSRMAVAVWRQVMRARRLRVTVVADGQPMPMRAAALTITVNPLDERSGRTLGRCALDGGQLCLYVLRRLDAPSMLGLVKRLLFGRRGHFAARASGGDHRHHEQAPRHPGDERRRVAGAAAALGIPPAPSGADRAGAGGMTVTRIAHITDLHFGAEDPSVVAALLEELNADPPDLVAISGDLTQGARIGEFRAARAFMDQLRAPTLAVPGNHDISPYNLAERFTNPYARWHRLISAETAPCWQNGSVAVLGLNSARRLGLHWDWSRGRVTHRRLKRLLARLEALPAALVKVVVMHHPLLPPETAPNTPVAGGAVVALRALSAHKVKLVLAGHLHRGFSRLALPSGEPPLILQGATATSVRLRGEPNAYNQITITEDGEPSVTIRVWDGGRWVGAAGNKAVAS